MMEGNDSVAQSLNFVPPCPFRSPSTAAFLTVKEVINRAALVSTDIMALWYAFRITAFLWRTRVGGAPGVTFDLARQQIVAASLLMALLVFLTVRGHYREKFPFWYEARQIILCSLLALLTSNLLQLSFEDPAPLLFQACAWISFVCLQVLCRQVVKRVLSAAGTWEIPVVLVWDPGAAEHVSEILNSDRVRGYHVITSFGPEVATRIGAEQGWPELLARVGARRIVVAVHEDAAQGAAILASIVRQQVAFMLIPPVTALPMVGAQRMVFLGHDRMMVSYQSNLSRPLLRIAKLFADVFSAALLLVMFAPLMAMLAILIRRDGGPAIFSHTRIGIGGRPFECLKFRTMGVNAEAVLAETLACDPELAAEWEAHRKLRNDPRITAIGRFLRTTSLDELPQLFNILRLEMSLVGPRPIVADEACRYEDDITHYYSARPGLTGLWQVSGRSETSFGRRVMLDAWYIRNWTLWHDFVIIIKTVETVLTRKGAR